MSKTKITGKFSHVVGLKDIGVGVFLVFQASAAIEVFTFSELQAIT